MPTQVSYPGVYIEEIPSGVRTITGVATSITAFIGRALRGPTDEPVTINSYGDFERIFGGLWVESTLGYAVRDFYLNGGSQAIIIRLYNQEVDKNLEAAAKAAAKAAAVADTAAAAQGATAADIAAKAAADKAEADAVAAAAKAAKNSTAKLTVGGLSLAAASEGAWGNSLRARIDKNVSTDDKVAQQFGPDLTKIDLFNLTIRDTASGVTEQFLNLTVKNSSRRVDNVLISSSQLVRATDTFPNTTTLTANADIDRVNNPKDDLWDPEKDSRTNKSNPYSVGVTDKDKKASDGTDLTKADNFTQVGAEAAKKGLYALLKADLFNILCIPPYTQDNDVEADLIGDAAKFCEDHRAFLIIDAPPDRDKDTIKTWVEDLPTRSNHAAVFFPRLMQPNPLKSNQIEEFASCGAMAGIFSRTDTQRGVWKAPAGLDATLVGVPQLSVPLTNAENGELNPLGINCLRTLPAAGRVVWGARTLQGDDRLASEWKYIPVRRLALYIEESLYRGTQWVVFEPNDEPLWAQIRLNIGAFMNNLFRQGAFQGRTPQEAYFVKCSSETTTQNDINLGIVNIVVGFAPLKPAEFVIIKLQQIAGQIAT